MLIDIIKTKLEKSGLQDRFEGDIINALTNMPEINIETLTEAIKQADSKDALNALMVYIIMTSAREYAEAKWNEAVKATQDSICEDRSTPPKFKP